MRDLITKKGNFDMYTKERIVEKIKALLRNAESFDAQDISEVATFYLKKAQELQQKYKEIIGDVDFSNLQSKDSLDIKHERHYFDGKRVSNASKLIATSLARLYGVQVLLDTPHKTQQKRASIIFVGPDVDVMITKQMFKTVLGIMEYSWQSYKSRPMYRALQQEGRHGKAIHTEWENGFWLELGRIIQEMIESQQSNTPQTSALIVTSKELTTRYIQETFNTKNTALNKNLRTSDASEGGANAAKNVKFNRTVSSTSNCGVAGHIE